MKTVQTPCKKKCFYIAKIGICAGCGRTLDEIERWSKYTEDEREYHSKLSRLRLEKINED